MTSWQAFLTIPAGAGVGAWAGITFGYLLGLEADARDLARSAASAAGGTVGLGFWLVTTLI